MAWQDIMVQMVRYLINDTAVPYRYNDDSISMSIVVGGVIATREFPFTTTYNFDFSIPDIIPDPTLSATYDPDAIALFTLKSACMNSLNDYQSAIGAGIKVKDGDTEVDTTGGFKGYSDLLKNGPCAAYKDLVKSIGTLKGMNAGKAVLSPYSSGNSSYRYGSWDIRGFYNSYFVR